LPLLAKGGVSGLPDRSWLGLASVAGWRRAVVCCGKAIPHPFEKPKGWATRVDLGAEARFWRWVMRPEAEASGYLSFGGGDWLQALVAADSLRE
jgi:hypothetical protein